MILEALSVILVTLFLLSLYFRYNKAGRLLGKIPGPKRLPLIGNALDISLCPEKLFKFARRMASTYRGIFKLSGLHLKVINIYAPQDIETVLSTPRFNEKSIPYNFLEPWLGKGLLVNNGFKWHQRRKMLTPAFHFNILRQFFCTLVEQTEELLMAVQKNVGKPMTEITPLINKTILVIMCETSMGNSMADDLTSVYNNYYNALHVLGKCVIHRISRIWLYPAWAFNLSPVMKIQKNALAHLHNFTRKIIEQRRNDQVFTKDDFEDTNGIKKKLALLDLLLEQERCGNIDEEGIREKVDTFMFAGHDTTSTALSFMIMRIANEPDVQHLIYEELHRIFGDSNRPPTMEDLKEMNYLERCIKESLRLYPAVPFITRQLREEVVLSGYTIPAGTRCNIQIFDIHRMEELYECPERFDPDRFLADNIAKRSPYAYIPFSAGPRNCIGQKFAMLQMKTVMSGLLRKFRLEPVTKPEDIVFICDLILRAKNPLKVRFCNRK